MESTIKSLNNELQNVLICEMEEIEKLPLLSKETSAIQAVITNISDFCCKLSKVCGCYGNY